MKQMRKLPIPFLILILAGAVSIYSLLASRNSRAATAQDNSLEMQTIEQERVAAVYFRVLSWLSDVSTRNPEPVLANSQPGATPQVTKRLRRWECQIGIELCNFHPGQGAADRKSRACTLN